MSIRFSGGDRFQRGRGVGGILRLAKSLFKPVMRTVGKAVKSNTGKAIGKYRLFNYFNKAKVNDIISESDICKLVHA